jgi:hypothetical protein|tara:strand:+ start:395 stop:607 length:213 start_codon:yes stop_codon:yes gene_type:complete
MSTGLESWANPETIGALYPFQGSEMLMFGLCVAFWLLWHVLNQFSETAEFAEDTRTLAGKPLPGEEYGDN